MNIAKFESERDKLFSQWGLTLWHFKYGTRKRALGVCNYRTRTIEVTRFHVENDTEENVLDTLKHEIAHAKAGRETGNPHGPRFVMWAKRIGCSVDGCAATAGVHLRLAIQPGRYQALCTGCGLTLHRHKMTVTQLLCYTYMCSTCGQKGLKFVDTQEAKKEVEQSTPKKSRFFS